MTIRDVARSDRAQWQALWDGYNEFYGRSGPTALDPEITELTWERFFDPGEPVHGLVAVEEERIVGLAHYLFHRSTTRSRHVCYLQDLFTLQSFRGRGIGCKLIEAVVVAAQHAGSSRVYWQTRVDNHVARVLYDRLAKDSGFMVYVREIE